MYDPRETPGSSSFHARRQLLLGAALLASGGSSFAQAGGGVARVIVPFAAGGAREMPARLILQDFAQAMARTGSSRTAPVRAVPSAPATWRIRRRMA